MSWHFPLWGHCIWGGKKPNEDVLLKTLSLGWNVLPGEVLLRRDVALRVYQWPRLKDSVRGPASVCVCVGPVGIHPVTSQLSPSVPSSTWSLHLTASLRAPCHHCGAAFPSACCRLLSLPALSPTRPRRRESHHEGFFLHVVRHVWAVQLQYTCFPATRD